MAISKQVKDGYLGDLPEAIQLKVMNIHKLLVSTCKEVWEDKNYNPIRNEDWAKSAIDEFCATPTNGTPIGAVRVYKQGKRYSCMIQLTGHVVNHRNDINHELLHDFFRHVHQDMKAKVRKQFDMRLTCESEHGEPWEGFDVWTSSKIAAAIWELFEDHKVKRVKPMKEGTEEDSQYERMFIETYELPDGIQELIGSTMGSVMESILDNLGESSAQLAADMLAGGYRIESEPIVCLRKQNGIVHGDIDIVECTLQDFHKAAIAVMQENIIDDPTKKLYVTEDGSDYTFSIALDSFYAEKLWDMFEKCEAIEEASHGKLKFDFRMAYDANNNHRLKIVYGLDGIKVTKTGHLGQDKDTIEKTIKKTGQLDHQSYGQKVLAIIDMETGEKLKTATMKPVYNYGDQAPTTITVGQVDNTPSFKATFWPKGGKHDEKLLNAMLNMPNAVGRGHKLHDLKYKHNDNSNEYDQGVNLVKQHPSKADKNRKAKFDKLSGEVDDLLMQSFSAKDSTERKAIADKARKALSDKDALRASNYGYTIEGTDIVFDPFMEADNNKPEYNTDMSEAEAKRTLRSLSQNIINDIANKKDYKVTQYSANIYANIISKNLLPVWAKGFRKLTITLDSYQSFFTFEFKVPKMTQDFVSRFIQGRETINGLIRRHPEINIKMSPRIFHTMKNPDDAFNFFRAAVKYYDSGLAKYSDKLMVEAMKLNHEMKHLISTTKLSGIITCPMQLLFIFDDVKMDNKDTFKISQEDIKTVNQFIRNIYTRYAAPEKEKKQIIEDVDKMVKAMRESCDPRNENAVDLQYLPEAVEKYLFGGFNSILEAHNEQWEREHFDMDWVHRQKDPKVSYMQEKWGVKKLKKIPADLVAYITIETESIRDANDKMMISSYCLSKIEIVEWYIELLDVGSKKYIVPHSKPYLVSLRTQLLACFKRIMEVKITNPNDRPIIDIKYPKGYEG